MFAEPYEAVDVERAVRAWARQVLSVPVFFGVNQSSPFPQVVLFRFGGTDESALFQFDVWGGTKQQAADIAADFATALVGLNRFVHDGVLLHGASWTSTRWMPDQEDDTPRYVVEASITATAS